MNKNLLIRRVLARRRIGRLCNAKALKKKLTGLVKRKKLENKFVQEKMRELKPLYSCSICTEICVMPVVLSCGDLFCYQCINEHLQKRARCPQCHSYIIKRRITKCNSMKWIVDLHFDQEDNFSVLEDRRSKELEVKEYSQSLKVNQPKIGMKVDVRDTGSIWCVGEIVKVIWENQTDELTPINSHHNPKRKNSSPYVKIHYFGWNNLYDEYFKFNSARIRPHGFYTSKTNMPRYANVSNDSDLLCSYVVEGQEQGEADPNAAQEADPNAAPNSDSLLRHLVEHMRTLFEQISENGTSQQAQRGNNNQNTE